MKVGGVRKLARALCAAAALLVVLPGPVLAAPAQPHGDEAHEGHHVPRFEDVNWFHGLLGEREGVEPNLLWRAPGTPAPVGAMVLNTVILVWLLVRFGGRRSERGSRRASSGSRGAS